MLKNKSLREFGYIFLGPIIATYVTEVNKQLRQITPQKNIKVFHLAREGYVFEQAFDIINKGDVSSSYLNVSRTFLFRITCHIEDSWKYSVKHSYKGTLSDFFKSRFAFTQENVEHFLDSAELEKTVSLPEDFEYVCRILKANQESIRRITTPTREVYLSYLHSVGFTDSAVTPVVLDVGYSGTIQKLLTLLLKKDTSGIYMITTKSGQIMVNDNVASVDHVFKTNVEMGGGYMMLDRSMFLESLLTAPNGQFVDIIKDLNNDAYHFCFGKQTYTQENFTDLSMVHDGALSCVEDCIKHNIHYTVKDIEELFETFVTHRNLLPRATWPLFVLDDAISGEGNLNPLRFFGL